MRERAANPSSLRSTAWNKTTGKGKLLVLPAVRVFIRAVKTCDP